MSPLRVWKRSGELAGVLAPLEGADLILPKALCPQLGGLVPFSMHLAAKHLAFWLPAAGFLRRLILIWYRWRLIYWTTVPRAGSHFDLGGRVLATPAAPLDAALAALII